MTSLMARIAVVGGLCLALAGVTVAGTALPVREPRPAAPVDPDGRTVTVCPTAPIVNLVSTTTWGALTSRPIGAEQAEPVPAGRGITLVDQEEPTLMIAEGRQNTGAAASAYARYPDGPDRGLALARCGSPATSAWFSGLVSDPDGPAATRSEVLLINADAGAAEVDLVLFGPNGLQIAAGARGIAVPARSVRSIALDTLFTRSEPVGLHVRSTRGRIATVVQQRSSDGPQTAGTDWQVPSAPPATEQIVPGIPGGPGPRTLMLTNPGNRRLTATIEVLGPEGTFVPAGASSLDVNAESTAAVTLHEGLAGEPGAVRVRAEQPFVAAVVSRSVDAPTADLAIQPATGPLSGTDIGAVAAAPGVRGTLLVTNVGPAEVSLPATVVDTEGRELTRAEVQVAPGTTAAWVIDGVRVPAAVRVDAPDDAQLYAGLVLTTGVDPADGLTTTPLSVPQQEQGGGVEPIFDPEAGR